MKNNYSNPMKKSLIVGLTYDLASDYRLEAGDPEDMYGEFDSEETLGRLETTISYLGHSVRRIGNIENLVAFLNQKQPVDVVFNIAEGRYGRSRESQIPALLESYSIPYTFSDPLTLAISLDKALTKQLWWQAGLPVAPFCVIEDVNDFDLPAGMKFPLFVKPLREGSSKGIRLESLVETPEQLRVQVERVLQTYRQPALVEEFLPGREFTVAVIGSGKEAKVLGALEVPYVEVCKVNDFRQKRDQVWKTYTPIVFGAEGEHPLSDQIAEISLRAYQTLGCHDAGRLDIRLDSCGYPCLMEINTLPGLSMRSALPTIASHAGLSFAELVEFILQSSMKRHSMISCDNLFLKERVK